jgi:adenylate kinase family enzyme
MKARLLNRAKTSGRVDDNEVTIGKRLKTFHNHTEAVLKHYEDNGKLLKVCFLPSSWCWGLIHPVCQAFLGNRFF